MMRILLSDQRTKKVDDLEHHFVQGDNTVTLTLLLRRDCHENGMTLAEYTDAVIDGKQTTLNHQEFEYQFQSLDSDVDIVCSFLHQYQIEPIRVNKLSASITAQGTVQNINQAFDIQLVNVQDSSGIFLSYKGSLSIPDHLDNIITAVMGLDNSIVVIPSWVDTNPMAVPDPNSVLLTPQQMAKAYNFPTGTGAGVCVGIIQFGGGYTQQNLTTSFAANGLSVPTIIPYPAGASNTPANNTESAEVVLDSLIVGGVAQGAKQVVYFGNGTSIAGWVNLFNAAIYDTVNKPSVLSVSWATPEANYWIDTMDTVLQAAAVLGITIVAASGDYGTRGPSSSSPNPTVNYPAVNPYVTAVGGTTLQTNPNGTIANEFVWAQGNASSGSGISIIYPLPSWQSNLSAKTYPALNKVSISRRAIPDISANGDPATGARFFYGTSNIASTTGGTSASAPLIAGLIAIMIERIGKNLGFLNPKFYTRASSFKDITVGNNACPDIGLFTGYVATTGWDACTGWGTPNGTQLLGSLVPGKIKTTNAVWTNIKDLQIKTSSETWNSVLSVYVKDQSGVWKQTYTTL